MELVVFHDILRNSTGNSPESLASVLLVKSSEGSGYGFAQNTVGSVRNHDGSGNVDITSNH